MRLATQAKKTESKICMKCGDCFITIIGIWIDYPIWWSAGAGFGIDLKNMFTNVMFVYRFFVLDSNVSLKFFDFVFQQQNFGIVD